MNVLRLVFALIRIPRLFATLLLFPLVIGLVIIYFQILAGSILLSSAKRDVSTYKQNLKERKVQSYVRQVLLKEEKPLGPLQICIWRELPDGSEEPVDPTCTLDLYDVVLQVSEPAEFSSTQYQEIFDGNFHRMHLCKNCSSDIVLRPEDPDPNVHIHSIFSLGLLSFVNNSRTKVSKFIESLDEGIRVKGLLGTRYLHAAGFSTPINLERAREGIVFIGNIAVLMIVSLWLAMKAHRKVLDYFADSGALLPLVAAAGKGNFYFAIWVLTALRVGLFLSASIPAMLLTFHNVDQADASDVLFHQDRIGLILWIMTLFVSFTYASFIASIGELRQRHHMLSVLYRYIPFFIAAIGSIAWAVSFLFETGIARYLRVLLGGLPLIGIVPTLFAPIITPPYEVMAVHALATTTLLIFTARANMKWFAAHLEEL